MSRLLKAAILCGAVPLFVGTLIYAGWRLTRWDWLMDAGCYTIYVGALVFVVGAVCLLRYLWRKKGVDPAVHRSLWLEGVLVGGLLLVNFPAAALFTLSAIEIVTRYTVVVFNDTDEPIESFVITGPRVRVELGPILAGKQAKRYLHFGGDGTLEFSARQHHIQFTGQLEAYVTHGLGGEKTIRVKPKGVYEIQANSG